MLGPKGVRSGEDLADTALSIRAVLPRGPARPTDVGVVDSNSEHPAGIRGIVVGAPAVVLSEPDNDGGIATGS